MLTLQRDPDMSVANEVLANLREREENELGKFLESPAYYVLESMKTSKYLFAIRDASANPVALTGISNLSIEEDGQGIVWLVSTKEVSKSPLAFCNIMMELIETYGYPHYDRLFNFVDEGAAEHIKFIELIGFSVLDEVYPSENLGMDFKMFEMWTPRGLDKMYYMEEPNG